MSGERGNREKKDFISSVKKITLFFVKCVTMYL